MAKKSPVVVADILERVGLAGMQAWEKRTGYKAVYLAVHPDAAGTVSYHFGMSPVDVLTHKLCGRSADGKKGRKGLRLLGDAFMSVLRHARFVEVPERLMELPVKALEEEKRDEDWEVAMQMDRVALEELEKVAPGVSQVVELLGKTEAEDWIRRIGTVDRVALLEA